MHIALVSDVHANLEALEAVLKHIETENTDTICSLGDVVGYGSDPSACLELIDKTCQIKLMGNHDYYALGRESSNDYSPLAKISAEWTKKTLTDTDISILDTFTMEEVIEGIHLVHASPFQPQEFHYILTHNDAANAFPNCKTNICFVGHTHVPAIFNEKPGQLPRQRVGHDFVPEPNCKYLINIGSVGQPRDNDPRASYVTYDTENRDVCYHRIEYDIKTAQRKMEEAKLPEMLIERLAIGK